MRTQKEEAGELFARVLASREEGLNESMIGRGSLELGLRRKQNWEEPSSMYPNCRHFLQGHRSEFTNL